MSVSIEHIPIAKAEQFKVFRNEIRPATLADLLDYITAMEAEMRLKKFTGKLTIDWNEGGKRRILAEQFGHEFVEE